MKIEPNLSKLRAIEKQMSRSLSSPTTEAPRNHMKTPRTQSIINGQKTMSQLLKKERETQEGICHYQIIDKTLSLGLEPYTNSRVACKQKLPLRAIFHLNKFSPTLKIKTNMQSKRSKHPRVYPYPRQCPSNKKKN